MQSLELLTGLGTYGTWKEVHPGIVSYPGRGEYVS